MKNQSFPEAVDTVIVGNGPSALILSFILHGNIPYYDPSKPHPDPILHKKLSESPCLLSLDVKDLTAHFAASRISYSTQALPVNVLLDTLIRPLHDTDPGKYQSCVEWRYQEEKAVSHVVLGNASHAGGQWVDNPVSASWDIGALSYAEMLSLPGYTFEAHNKKIYKAPLPNFHRPSRREVAAYLATYPAAVGINGAVHTDAQVNQISRQPCGFRIGSHNLNCRHLVLASGVFSKLIPPRPLLRPLGTLHASDNTASAPLLVVGSGFTAADVILSTPPGRKIIHIFKWDPDEHPSPLRACHPRAYPEYSSVYKHMKLAARAALGSSGITSPIKSRKTNPFFQDRDWDSIYEGLPNTYIKDVALQNEKALLVLEAFDGSTQEREVSGMEYVIGRRGSLDYLSQSMQHEIGFVEDRETAGRSLVSGLSLRNRVESNLQIATGVFTIGSLTGDSLIRFAYGGCVFAAGDILRSSQSASISPESSSTEGSDELSTASSSPLDMLPNPSSAGFYAGGHPELQMDKWTFMQ